jgi:hypothetical protein
VAQDFKGFEQRGLQRTGSPTSLSFVRLYSHCAGLSEKDPDKISETPSSALFYHDFLEFPISFASFVRQEQILAALNVPPLNANEGADFLELYVAAGGKLANSRIRYAAPRLLSTKLRKYVNQWLSTGIDKDGCEVPSARKILEYAFMAVQDYMERYPPRFLLTERGLTVTLVLGGPPGRSMEVRSLFDEIEEEAKRLFTCLITSDWKDRFAKCPYAACGSYFVRPKIRRKYRRGVFCCRRHQALAVAEACTKKLRTTADHALIDLAAKQLIAWNVNDDQWPADAQLKRRLAAKVAQLMAARPALRSHRQSVRVNWVTRHQQQIEAARVATSQRR